MNPRCPVVKLTAAESRRLNEIADSVGDEKAITLVGLRCPETFYRACAGRPIARLTAEVIRSRLDRI